jgi:hypothetical protein
MTPPLHRPLVALLLFASSLAAQTKYDPKTLPKGREYFELRDGIANAQLKFPREKTGRIAFLGGSITAESIATSKFSPTGALACICHGL